MTKRQPSYKETIEEVKFISRIEAYAANVSEQEEYNGEYVIWVRYKRSRLYHPVRLPYSDITKKCGNCGCILIDKRDALGCFAIKDLSKKAIQAYCTEYIDICLRCYNKRKPLLKALLEWNETRLMVNRVQRSIYDEQRNQVPQDEHPNDRRPSGVSK